MYILLQQMQEIFQAKNLSILLGSSVNPRRDLIWFFCYRKRYPNHVFAAFVFANRRLQCFFPFYAVQLDRCLSMKSPFTFLDQIVWSAYSISRICVVSSLCSLMMRKRRIGRIVWLKKWACGYLG